VIIWCADSQKCIIGPYFLEKKGKTVPANKCPLHQYSKYVFKPTLRKRRPTNKPLDVLFHQDGAPPHAAIATINIVHKMFLSRRI